MCRKFLNGVIFLRINRIKSLVLCSMFAALITAGAFIKIPVPVVPFTLQFLFTSLAGLLLGAEYGAVSVAIYIITGLLGVPVFANGGGISYVLQPSFGYMPGFALGAYVTGKIACKSDSPSYRRLAAANFAGLLVVYTIGMAYYALMSRFYLGTPVGLWPLFLYCFILAVPGDIALCLSGAMFAKILNPVIKERHCNA
ncbi:MAG: biotin transporter BioY [Synergistaceae bacterium]|nr:biotin transporter BioY [Synergistaceae bacterium]